LTTCLMVSARTFAGVISILVMQMTTGTLRARDIAKCSLDIPISPAAFAPTIRKTHDGAPEVRPYNVVYTMLTGLERERRGLNLQVSFMSRKI
jgi:hypothetical protein